MRKKWSDRTLLRAIRRDKAIEEGKLREYRMPGHTHQPAKGKGVPYKRNKNMESE